MDNETTTPEMDSDFEAFESAFEGGNQTDESTAEDTESTTESKDETQEAPEADKTEPDNTEHGEEENGSKTGQEADTASEQKFTIRVNKEDREVGLEEMTTLAQKGANYDKVKERLDAREQEVQALQNQISANAETLEMLTAISEGTGKPLSELVETLYLNWEKSKGTSESEAKLRLENSRQKKALEAIKAEQQAKKTKDESAATRAKREVEEFRKEFPGVELTKELCDSLMSDVQAGMTLSNAYRKAESARKDTEILELRKQLEAEKQNKKNREKSPGSLGDTGGQKAKSDFDEFMAAFNK